jgi:hypothetical protein
VNSYSLNQRTNVLCNFLKQNCKGVSKSPFNNCEYWVEDLGDFIVIHKDELKSYVVNVLKDISVTSDWKYYYDDLLAVFKKSGVEPSTYNRFFLKNVEKISGGKIRAFVEKNIGVERFVQLLADFYVTNNKMKEVAAQQNDVDFVDQFFYSDYYIYQIHIYEFA